MTTYDAERLQAVAVMEALRAGVPTRVSTKSLPDLRGELTKLIQSDLESFRQGHSITGRMVWGSYGQGKTHVLTTVEHLALDMGFAVSRISLSREVSCHNLGNFFGRVAPLVRTPDSSLYGLQRKLNDITEHDLPGTPLKQPGRYSHPFPAIVFEDYFFTAGEEQDLIYGYLMGNNVAVNELKRIHRVRREQPMPRFSRSFKAREDSTAFFGILADAIHLCGYKGWVILIDELELIGRMGKVSRLNAYRNLNWLFNWSGTMKYPIYVVGAAATSLLEDIWRPQGANKFKDMADMPIMAENRLGAEAGNEIKRFFEIGIGDTSPIIKPVTMNALIGLLEELVKIHGLAYAWSAELDIHRLLHDLGTTTVRTYIRATLEALDIRYLYQEDIVPETKELVACTLEEDKSFFAEPEDKE